MNDAIIIDTPAGILYASLCALRGALKLERLGMRRRGHSANTIACKRLGLPKGTRIAVTLTVLDSVLADLLAELEGRK
jgi:hypothetical protein